MCLGPFFVICVNTARGHLTANPVEYYQHETGDWTLYFLIFCLAVTPLRKILNLPDLIRFRRMLGLFAFFYVCLHFLTYIGPDQSFDLSGMWKDVQKRRFVTVGFAAFLLLIPLAITSTRGWIRRLGEALADASPRNLLRSGRWCDPLLLVGQIRCPQALYSSP